MNQDDINRRLNESLASFVNRWLAASPGAVLSPFDRAQALWRGLKNNKTASLGLCRFTDAKGEPRSYVLLEVSASGKLLAGIKTDMSGTIMDPDCEGFNEPRAPWVVDYEGEDGA